MANIFPDEPIDAVTDTDPVNPLDGLLGYQLRRASAWVIGDLGKSLVDLDLRPTEASILLLIEASPDITQSDIGRVLGIQRANMAPITAVLIKRELIDKARADGRSHALRLTESGAAMAREIARRVARHEARFLPELSPDERKALVALMRRVWNG